MNVCIITFVFIVLDFVSGMLNAFISKSFNSSVMREGLGHKVGSVIAIVFGVLVDYAQSFVDLGVNIPIASAICTYIILMEIGSIIENIGRINPEIIPSSLKKYFTKLSD